MSRPAGANRPRQFTIAGLMLGIAVMALGAAFGRSLDREAAKELFGAVPIVGLIVFLILIIRPPLKK